MIRQTTDRTLLQADLTNSPARIQLLAEQRHSFSLGVYFETVDQHRVNITDCVLTMAVSKPVNEGGGFLFSKDAVIVDGPYGHAQFNFQAADLDLEVNQYEFIITLLTPFEYSSPIAKGFLQIAMNPSEGYVDHVYDDAQPPDSITATIGENHIVGVVVNHLAGLAVDIGEVSYVEGDEPPRVWITGDYPYQLINFKFPKGGPPGPPGEGAGYDWDFGSPWLRSQSDPGIYHDVPSITHPLPDPIELGDQLVVFLSAGQRHHVMPPAGWEVVTGISQFFADPVCLSVYYKKADADDLNTGTVTIDGTHPGDDTTVFPHACVLTQSWGNADVSRTTGLWHTHDDTDQHPIGSTWTYEPTLPVVFASDMGVTGVLVPGPDGTLSTCPGVASSSWEWPQHWPDWPYGGLDGPPFTEMAAFRSGSAANDGHVSLGVAQANPGIPPYTDYEADRVPLVCVSENVTPRAAVILLWLRPMPVTDAIVPPSDQVLGFTFNQPVAASTWNIDHPLDFQPNVAIVDSAGDEVEGEVRYIGSSTVTITFSAAFTGTAYLS